ncbi:MAG: hypothetical protein MMC23_008196 [Stictis urceolatum]|nr:hypothetical protein [Stictis urceolata]
MSASSPHKTLKLGEDFSTSPNPVKAPSSSSHNVLVIGAGVAGLKSAWMLLDAGHNVTILAKEWATFTSAQRITSQISGALWEFPSAPCGPRIQPENLDKLRTWALESHKIYSELASDPKLREDYGVRVRKNLCCFPMAIADHDVEHERAEAIQKAGVPGFKWDKSLIGAYDNSGHGAVDAFEHLSPVIDTDQGMKFMMDLVKAKGAKLVTGEVKGDVLDHEDELKKEYGVDIIVNCTGLNALETASDKNIHAGRGGVLRVLNDGKVFPKIEHAMVVNTKDPEDYNIVFVVPRNEKILILGTFIEEGETEFSLKVDSPAMVEMKEKCERFLPQLKGAELDPEYPMAQGIRPLRKGDVKVGKEDRKEGSRIVHAYGHGIGGWSSAWGSAFEVASLVASY